MVGKNYLALIQGYSMYYLIESKGMRDSLPLPVMSWCYSIECWFTILTLKVLEYPRDCRGEILC